ncbi:SDR family oxidoreductase [Myxococcota bacterium]|nr:SDR family oxidoreductase [Myxococcota bacterium]
MSESSRTQSPIAGKRILVVGASSGIGKATARALASDGARLWLGGRNLEPLEAAVADLEEVAAHAGGSVTSLRCDASRPEDVRAAVEQAAGSEGLDAAVTIPGGGNYCPILGYDDDRFSAEVDNNVRPQFLVLKYAGLSMVASGGGSIVAVSSTASILSSPYLSAYCAGKAAVDQMVRVAADELGEQKIRVNSVRPGLTHTGATGFMFDTPEVLDSFLEQQPIARGGESEDIARCIRFLAGPESSWITGQCITVDGGHTLRRFPDSKPLARQVVGEELFDSVLRGEIQQLK